MDFNFFEWIREGVKRSVLLGVSDAVETMGAPHDPEETRDKVLNFLRDESGEESGSKSAKRRAVGTTTTRKLGRSISEIHPTS